jgi:hypothetical protein
MGKFIAACALLAFSFFLWPKAYIPFDPSVLVYDVLGGYPSFECPEFEKIVEKPLVYLGMGRQSIAFESSDGRYVVKFFLFKRLHESNPYALGSIRNLLPWHVKKKEAARQKSRKKYSLHAIHNYDMMFRRLKEEAGLVAVHLGASPEALPMCKVFDRQGKMHEVDLARASFVVQYKAEQRVPTEEDRNEIRELLERRALKGFKDRRRFQLRHIGFHGKRAMIVDPGNMELYQEILANPKDELDRINLLRF